MHGKRNGQIMMMKTTMSMNSVRYKSLNKSFKLILLCVLSLFLLSCDSKNNQDKNTQDKNFTSFNSKNNIKEEKKVKLPKPKWDTRLQDYKGTFEWFYQANDSEQAAYNIGNTYRKQIKDYKKAIQWYLYSHSIKTNSANLGNLGITYQDIKDYTNAIKYYKQAFNLGNKKSANNLGGLLQNIKDYKNAEIWYKKAIQKNSTNAIKNIAILYHDNLKDDIKASAYYITLIDVRYSKELTLKFLQERWKLSNETIKKGYDLQLKMKGLPKRYTGDLGLKD